MATAGLVVREKAMEEVRPCAKQEDRAWPAAAIFALLGVASDVTHLTLGLQASSWFLLAIGAMLAAVFFRLGRLAYWYLETTK